MGVPFTVNNYNEIKLDRSEGIFTTNIRYFQNIKGPTLLHDTSSRRYFFIALNHYLGIQKLQK